MCHFNYEQHSRTPRRPCRHTLNFSMKIMLAPNTESIHSLSELPTAQHIDKIHIASFRSKSRSLIARELRDALCASSFAQLSDPPCLSMRNNAPVEHCAAEAQTSALIAPLTPIKAFSIELAFCDVNSYNQLYMPIYRLSYKAQ